MKKSIIQISTIIFFLTFMSFSKVYSQCTIQAWGYVDDYMLAQEGKIFLNFVKYDFGTPTAWGVRYREYKSSGNPNPWIYTFAQSNIKVDRCKNYEWQFGCSGLMIENNGTFIGYYYESFGNRVYLETYEEQIAYIIQLFAQNTPLENLQNIYLDGGMLNCGAFVPCDVNFEPNNSFTTAKMMNIGDYVYAQKANENDVDYFSFIPTSNAVKTNLNCYNKYFNSLPVYGDINGENGIVLCTPGEVHYIKHNEINCKGIFVIEPSSIECYDLPITANITHPGYDYCSYKISINTLNYNDFGVSINNNLIHESYGNSSNNLEFILNQNDYVYGDNYIIINASNSCGASTQLQFTTRLNDDCGLQIRKPKINSNDDILLYPNPVKSILNVEFNGMDVDYIEIINSLGQMVKGINKIEKKSKSLAINIESFSQGAYFIKFASTDSIITKKFIVK